MTRSMKLIVLGSTVALVVLILLLWQPFASKTGSDNYIIQDGHVSGELVGSTFTLTLDAEIDADENVELSTFQATQTDYMDRRVDILERVFDDMEGLTGIVSGTFDFSTGKVITHDPTTQDRVEGEVLPIDNLNDLDEYVSIKQEKGTSRESTIFDITPEDHAFTESYLKDGVIFNIDHRENLVRFIQPYTQEMDLQSQLKEFAQAFLGEEHFTFDDSYQTEDGLAIPVMVNDLPIVSFTRDFLLDKNEELYVLAYMGYKSNPMGLFGDIHSDMLVLQAQQIFLPGEVTAEKMPVISVRQAIEALSAKLDKIYIDDQVPSESDYEDVFVINKIQLAYAAFHQGKDSFTLRPIYVFVNKGHSFDACFHVDALTGEVYPAVSSNYANNVLNPLK